MNTDTKPNGRRERIYMMDESDVLRLFSVPWSSPGFVRIPVSFEVPDSAKVLAVHYDYAVRGFAFIVEHESFEVVPSGHVPPIHSLGSAEFMVLDIPFKGIHQNVIQ